LRHYREFETIEVDGILYRVFQQDIGTLVLKKSKTDNNSIQKV
jgi:hypothetical protein